MKDTLRRHAALSFLLGLASLASAQAPATGVGRLLFQTDHAWSPRTNINADTVMVYGLDDTTASRIESWRAHGYHVAVMTGVAWGRYGAYLRGDFDGKHHWDETQQEKSGKLILHGGREVPYVSPSLAYGQFLAKGAEAAMDAGAEAIYLEEPEFWARAGWSPSFQREWQNYYHQSWQPPDSSPDAQYRASKLKYYLYRRALAQVFDAVKTYSAAHHRVIRCYVATHSLINYAQWSIVSPESSLLEVGADGYIAQVWTGTAREPNMYEGKREQRTFETAFLEYGALQNIARSSGKPIWFLNDPIEDNPRHSWTDYRANWESTLVASLLQPAVARYEVLPWPDRIFGLDSQRPSVEPTPEMPNPPQTVIPKPYETELQAVFHALAEFDQTGHMDQTDHTGPTDQTGQTKPASATRWERAGTQGIGVLVSDTLMFQRAQPQPSDPNLSNFYGLALPLLMRGIPVEPVQIESTYSPSAPRDFLDPYKVLLLSYEGQKPPSPQFHLALANWVRQGGALVITDDAADPYNRATDWWNSGQFHFANPLEHLLQQLGLDSHATGLHAVGKGYVLYTAKSPSALAGSNTGADEVLADLHTAADAIRLPVHYSNALVLRRGPYVIAAGLDQPFTKDAPTELHGDFIDLFDPELGESDRILLQPGSRALRLDLREVSGSTPRVLAASARITNEQAAAGILRFDYEGIEGTAATMRILTPQPVRSVLVNAQPLPASAYQQSARTLLLHLHNTASPQHVELRF
jgi:hypothetical protein